MHRGETEKSMAMNMKALHLSLMKQNTAMMPIVSIKIIMFVFQLIIFLILAEMFWKTNRNIS